MPTRIVRFVIIERLRQHRRQLGRTRYVLVLSELSAKILAFWRRNHVYFKVLPQMTRCDWCAAFGCVIWLRAVSTQNQRPLPQRNAMWM
jgi:hypothetical protein